MPLERDGDVLATHDFATIHGWEINQLEKAGLYRDGKPALDGNQKAVLFTLAGLGSVWMDMDPLRRELQARFGESIEFFPIPLGGCYHALSPLADLVANRVNETVTDPDRDIQTVLLLCHSSGGRVGTEALSRLQLEDHPGKLFFSITLGTPYTNERIQALTQHPKIPQLAQGSEAVSQWMPVRVARSGSIGYMTYASPVDGVVLPDEVQPPKNGFYQWTPGIRHAQFLDPRQIMPYLENDIFITYAAATDE